MPVVKLCFPLQFTKRGPLRLPPIYEAVYLHTLRFSANRRDWPPPSGFQQAYVPLLGPRIPLFSLLILGGPFPCIVGFV